MEQVSTKVPKTKLIIDRNVVTLPSTQMGESSDEDDAMTGDSNSGQTVLLPPTISAPPDKDRKRVHTQGM